EAVVRCIQQTLEQARADWQEKFLAPSKSEPTTSVFVKAVPDLRLRAEVTTPEATHRELPNLGAVPDAGLSAVTLAKADDPGRVHGPDIAGRSRLAGRRFDTARDAAARPSHHKLQLIGAA